MINILLINLYFFINNIQMKRITKFIFYTILPLIKILVFAGFVFIIGKYLTKTNIIEGNDCSMSQENIAKDQQAELKNLREKIRGFETDISDMKRASEKFPGDIKNNAEKIQAAIKETKGQKDQAAKDLDQL
tara:strand:+ start:942 stop:1337 length:396 start_codon:yes stop_codon:yes gene_type:complete